LKQRFWSAVYLLLVVAFLRHLASFWMPLVGFSSWIQFGNQLNPPLRMLEQVDFFVFDGAGYDGQFYAQLACQPDLSNPELKTSIDNLPYRARRILSCWLAHWMGGGDPWWTLQAYAMQPVLAWLGLAVLLLRWYPPGSLDHALRWSLTLLGWGLLGTIYQSVPDGLALLLMLGALMLLERGQRGGAVGLVALASLLRETSLLALVMFWPGCGEGRRRWLRASLEVLLAMLPLGLWLAYLKWGLQLNQNAGSAAFGWPGQGWWGKLLELLALDFGGPHRWLFVCTGLAFVGLTLQALYVLARPHPQEQVWRLAAVHAGLMLVLGQAVWEGHPGAALRVMLPLTLMFNRLVPQGKRGIALLLLGNLSCLSVLLYPRVGERPGLTFRHHLCREVLVRPDPGWVPSRAGDGRPRMSSRRPLSEIRLVNSGKSPRHLSWHGSLRCTQGARVRWERDGQVLWQGLVGRQEVAFELPPLRLEPGEHRLEVEVEAPPDTWLHAIGQVVEVVVP